MYWYFEPLAQTPRGQARIKADQRRVMRVTARDDVYLQARGSGSACLAAVHKASRKHTCPFSRVSRLSFVGCVTCACPCLLYFPL